MSDKLDEKALQSASRAYCDVIRLNYDGLPAQLAEKRDEAMRAAITAYLQALSPGSTGSAEGWEDRALAAEAALSKLAEGIDFMGNSGWMKGTPRGEGYKQACEDMKNALSAIRAQGADNG